MPTRTTSKRRKTSPPDPLEGLTFSNPDKVMFPANGYTKADLLTYYAAVADRLIPHLRGRPLTLERVPDGVGGGKAAPHFWQKNSPDYYPDWIPRARLQDQTGKTVQYALVNDARSLLYLVNQGTITFHVFLSRVESLDRPDYVLFDLDPGERTFADAIRVAKAIRTVLDEQRVKSFPKTSGKTGIHILAPWTKKGGYEEARAWAVGVAERVVREMPDVATLERLIKNRGGRLYLDVMQNSKGHHVVPPYVVRAVPAATVSTPLDWNEVTARLTPARFDMTSALKRFESQKDPMAAIISASKTRGSSRAAKA